MKLYRITQDKICWKSHSKEETPKLVWSRATNGRLEKSETGTALDS